MLAGAGLAGKTSTLRWLQRDCIPAPTDEDARTVQLDIWTLVLGKGDAAVVASVRYAGTRTVADGPTPHSNWLKRGLESRL